MAFNVKNEVLIRIYLVLAVIVLVAVAIFTQAVKISVIEGEKWRSKGQALYIKEVPMEAERGNIITEDGSMLATSMPFFDIHWDPNSKSIDTTFWSSKSFDSLAYYLATYVNPSMTPGAMKEYLWQQKSTGKSYVEILENATMEQKERIASFPLFNRGQFKGGLIVVQKYNRERPFRLLANRTIGYVQGDSVKVGIEGAFNDVLQGEEGTQLMYRVGGGMWIPLENLAKIEPKPGQDIVTTIDVNLQDITESALQNAMVQYQAESGVAILMEVKTGAIRAIANLGWTKDGQIWETYNHAIGSATEPGSTFKLASMLALLEDGYIDLDDSIDLEQGVTIYHDSELKDAKEHHYNNVTARQAFAMSSNVGVSRMVYNAYGEKNKADKYIQHLHDFFLDQPSGIEVGGEVEPYIKRAYNEEDGWSGTTLPWMSIGYELTITPLQLLAFYNAVANDGVYVKPYLAKEIQQYGVTLKKFPITEVKGRIASKKAIRQAQELLTSVVDSTWGTAYKKGRNDAFTFAGKTGTAQLNYQKLNEKTKVGGYQASFAGYFPAKNPVYSCIVLISKPKAGVYGGVVALPVFEEIAAKAIATRSELFPVLNSGDKIALESSQLPDKDAGLRTDIQYVMSEFGLDYFNKSKGDWASLRSAAPDSLKLMNRPVEDKKVPNVIGMGLRDALFLLENKGLKVQFSGGYGKVVTQSITPGTRAAGQTVWLRLG